MSKQRIKKKRNQQSSLVSKMSDDVTLVTTTENQEQYISNLLSQALRTYSPDNNMYTAYLKLTDSREEVTKELIDDLGMNAQTNLDKVERLNSLVRRYANVDDLIGMVVQSITNNINTEYTLSWKSFGKRRNKTKILDRAKEIIEDFNEQIDISQLIRDAVELTYLEGNYNCLLRHQDGIWGIEYLPLGVCEVSDYLDNGRPILLINMNKMKGALQKTTLRNRKGQPIFFKDMKEEIFNTFSEEIVEGYDDNSQYVRLRTDYTGTCRINNRCRNYGISPIVRALTSALMLNNFYKADTITAKAKSKKIIHQVLRKELLGSTGQGKGLEDMAYAHKQLMEAWKNPTVVYTSSPAVEKIVYVEPQTEEISPEKVRLYRNKVLSSLGVSFLTNDNSQTASTANISLKQLLKCIDRIGEQIQRMLQNFYKTVLSVNGIEAIYCPTIQIIDSEMLEADMKISMAQFLYGTLNCSRETAYKMVGIDVEDEKQKRSNENDNDFDSIFTAHATAYTKSAKDSENTTTTKTDRQEYDQQYNETRK